MNTFEIVSIVVYSILMLLIWFILYKATEKFSILEGINNTC